jgi:hypothetical protein
VSSLHAATSASNPATVVGRPRGEPELGKPQNGVAALPTFVWWHWSRSSLPRARCRLGCCAVPWPTAPDSTVKPERPGQGYDRPGGPCAGRLAGRFQPTARLSFFSFPFFNIHRNSYKFPNFIENYSNLIKMQSKFRMDPPEKIYALGLTKSLFMHYCLVDKSKKSNFEEFIYKNLCMFIH